MKKITKVCYEYDWKVANENSGYVIDMISDANYYVYKEWSAYNFLFLKGSKPMDMFFSLKRLTIESQYNKELVNRLKKYEII